MGSFKEHGSEAAVKAAGGYRQQGKNYIVEDGDIIFFKFNAGAGLTAGKKEEKRSKGKLKIVTSKCHPPNSMLNFFDQMDMKMNFPTLFIQGEGNIFLSATILMSPSQSCVIPGF